MPLKAGSRSPGCRSSTAGWLPVLFRGLSFWRLLARLLRALLPDDAGVSGLLALVLLHSRAAIDEGVALVGEGLARTALQPDRYVVQAAVAARHCLARTWQDTDWTAILSWYDVLATLDPSPVIQLNRAVALAERDGPAAGPTALDGLRLPGYALLPATRAELLVRLDRTEEAAAALREALTLPLNDAQRQLLQQRLACL